MSLATFELSSPSEAEEESLMNKTGNPLCGLFENKRWELKILLLQDSWEVGSYIAVPVRSELIAAIFVVMV